MRFIIILSILFFLFLAFLGNSETAISNPFLAYLFLILKTIVKYFPYFLIIFCVIFLILIKPYLSRKHLTLKIIFHTFFQLLAILVIGVFFSFVILIFIAFVELNIFSVALNHNPSILGVKTDTDEILTAIKSNNKPPILITNENKQNEVIAIAKASAGTTNFYGVNILSGIPSVLILPVNDNANLLFLDNTLVVKKIDEKEMQKLSPIIGYQIIKSYFPLRNIKSAPKISVMDENEYNSYRKLDVKSKLAKVEVEIDKTEKAINSLTEEIENDDKLIEQNETDQKDILTRRDKEYNSCLSEGTYELKVFVPKNSKEFCQQIIDEWEDDFITEADNGKKLLVTLEDKKKRLNENKFYNNYFKAQKKLIDISSINVTSELGVFEPENSIKLIINDSSSTAIADYFGTLSHEYLHFASYVPGKRLESSFFEEALTEYFTRQAIRDSIQTDINLGYPAAIKIIEELSKKISEPDLAEIYFNKDQKELENKLNLVYGEDFYNKNIVLFESLQYTSDPDIALEIINRIMDRIGGNSLEKKDIFSTESKI